MKQTRWFLVMEMSYGLSVISNTYDSLEEAKADYDTWPQNEGVIICQTVEDEGGGR